MTEMENKRLVSAEPDLHHRFLEHWTEPLYRDLRRLRGAKNFLKGVALKEVSKKEHPWRGGKILEQVKNRKGNTKDVLLKNEYLNSLVGLLKKLHIYGYAEDYNA